MSDIDDIVIQHSGMVRLSEVAHWFGYKPEVASAKAAEAQRVEDEQRAKVEAEQKAKADKERKAREKRLQPDKEKLIEFAEFVICLRQPDLKSDEAKALLKDYVETLSSSAALFVEKAKGL